MTAFIDDFKLLDIAIAIFLLPVSAFLVLSLNHKRVYRHGDWLATGCMGICLILSLLLFSSAVGSTTPILEAGSGLWLPLSLEKGLSGGFLFDSLTATMLVVVCLISFLVHLFSIGYMEGDIRYGRYYCCLLLFSASMLGLVLSGSMLFLFIFWELVGLSSYLLISHWYQKKSAADAAMKAFITTRIGDVGMFLGLLLCYQQSGSLNFIDIFAAVETGSLDGSIRTLAGLGIFFGAMGKSAQFPLHVWLPDAMEGPTPVSALIHAATMVAAGVYLVGRMHPLFDDFTLMCIAYIGAFTAFFAATIALVQDDMKKVLAYSTVSQLGYMMLALGVGGYVSGLFHLTTHALFKGGLFLGAGAIIYAMHHEQSMSKYGGLWRKMPVTFACYICYYLALIGFVFTSGWHSKDAILVDAWLFSLEHGHWFLPIAGLATVFLTAFYMSRQVFLTFFGAPRDSHAYDHAHEVPWVMRGPLILLAVLSLTAGGWQGKWFGELNPKLSGMEQIQQFSQQGNVDENVEYALIRLAAKESEKPHFISGEVHGGDHDIAHHDEATHAHHKAHEAAHTTIVAMASGLLLCGLALAALLYWERKDGSTIINAGKIAQRFGFLHRLLFNKYYLDEVNSAIWINSIKVGSRLAALFDARGIDRVVNAVGPAGLISSDFVEKTDRVVVDGGMVMGTAKAADSAGSAAQRIQTGYLQAYLLCTFVAAAFLLYAAIVVFVF